MKRFFRFVFPFLFQRNWHTGEVELSRTRFTLVLFALGTIAFFLLAVTVLQWPVEYESPTT